jgi:hypothetical protein
MRICVSICFLLTFSKAHAQTLGGNTAYNFLKLPFATTLTAMGGVNISHQSTDVSFALNNPAQLNASLHAQMGLNFTQLVAGVKGYQLAGAYYNPKSNTTFGAQIFFVNYGQIDATDAAGNLMGHFHANDYVVQFSASQPYLEKWHYGASIKFIQSNYQLYHSSALAVDVGINYFDSTNGISIAAVAKNMGMQLKTYAGETEELPFDLELGLTKKLAQAPFAFSLTIQQAHRFNLLYNDTTFNFETNNDSSNSFFNKAMQHLVLAAHILISKQLEATIGYNHLRRSELSLGTSGNGLAGFSAGIAARFEKLHVSYARSVYQRGIGYNQLGLNLLFDKLFGAGTF